MIEIEKIRRFSSEYDYTAFSVIRLHPKIIKVIGGRNTWVKISSESCHVYRLALGAKSSTGFTAKSIELDYDSCLELNSIAGILPRDENGFYPCSMKIEKAPFIGKLIAHWKHPNPGYRVPLQISMVSFILGFMGFLIGLMSLA
jgi:hypothetical protein